MSSVPAVKQDMPSKGGTTSIPVCIARGTQSLAVLVQREQTPERSRLTIHLPPPDPMTVRCFGKRLRSAVAAALTGAGTTRSRTVAQDNRYLGFDSETMPGERSAERGSEIVRTELPLPLSRSVDERFQAARRLFLIDEGAEFAARRIVEQLVARIAESRPRKAEDAVIKPEARDSAMSCRAIPGKRQQHLVPDDGISMAKGSPFPCQHAGRLCLPEIDKAG